MQGDAVKVKAKLDIKSEFLETKKIVIDIIRKGSSNELITTIGKAFITNILESRTQELSKERLEAIMSGLELSPKSFNVVFEVELQFLNIHAHGSQSVKNDLGFTVRTLPLGG